MNNITIQTKQIDGYTIITNFSQATVDPEATKAAVAPLIDAHENAPMIQQKKQEIGTQNRRLNELRLESVNLWTVPGTRLRKPALTAEEKKVDLRIANDWNGVEVNINAIQDELTALWDTVIESKKELTRANPVFFEPNEGVYHLDEAKTGELMALQLGKADTEAVTIDGEVVPDYRGKLFQFQVDGVWGKRTIVALGEFPGDTEIIDADLTDEQRAEIAEQQESERVEGLTDKEKTAEYDGQAAALLTKAGQMKNELEISGDVDALAKSQEWYQGEISELKLKYEVM